MHRVVTALVFGFAPSGCLRGYRVTPAATVDDHGRPGATLLVGGTLGVPLQYPQGFTTTLEVNGGVVAPRPVTGLIRGTLAFEWLGNYKPVAVRIGGALGVGRVLGDSGDVFFSLGGRLAILPVVFRKEERGAGGECASPKRVVLKTMHVGLALSADYQLGANRNLFTFGPSFESYGQAHCPGPEPD